MLQTSCLWVFLLSNMRMKLINFSLSFHSPYLSFNLLKFFSNNWLILLIGLYIVLKLIVIYPEVSCFYKFPALQGFTWARSFLVLLTLDLILSVNIYYVFSGILKWENHEWCHCFMLRHHLNYNSQESQDCSQDKWQLFAYLYFSL